MPLAFQASSLELIDTPILLCQTTHVHSLFCPRRLTLKMVFLRYSIAAMAALAEAGTLAGRGGYPFSKLVAFGDELSDNGNGSFAHGITGNPATVYGFGTWTNGPVAVSYLADLLSAPLTDFAFGGCCGGGSYGATLDNAYTSSPANAQSLVDQIQNYTASPSFSRVSQSLGFVWVGMNDLSAHTDAFWGGDPKNTDFATAYATKTVASVKKLLGAGAPAVLVANIYPKQAAPVTAKYLCGTNTDCVKTWGQVIQSANTALQKALVPLGNRVIYYDSFGFLTSLMANAQANGFTQPLTDICDGAGDAQWAKCWKDGVGLVADGFFWLNFIQPTTQVHRLIAADMKKTIDKHYGL